MKHHHALSLSAILACTTWSVGASADHIVLLSESDNFSIGQILCDPIILRLESGERVVLMSDRGDVLDIAGPFEGSPAARGSNDFNLKSALAGLIDNPNNLHAALGGTRSGTGLLSAKATGPIWSLDPYASGVQCVVAGEPLEFWRPDTGNVLHLQIQRPGHEGTGAITFESNSTTAHWPDEIPLNSGELYVVSRPGWLESAMFHIALLPALIAENAETSIAWLATNGCKRQATLLMDELPE